MDRDVPGSVLLKLGALSSVAVALLFVGCAASRMAGGNMARLVGSPAPVASRITHPVRSDARLAALWIGHATVLLQIDDKEILTDPFLTPTVGQLSKRMSEPGIDPANLPRLDAVLVSHMHFDHLSLGSLELIEDKTRLLFVPQGGLVYIPSFRFDARELPTWQSWEKDGLRITAVPAEHVGWRYGVDAAWMKTTFTGYVIEYHGVTVYFSGDTAFDAAKLRATRARFPHIDLAFLPIAPIHPRDYMGRVHMDPTQALDAFALLDAKAMIPIHFETLVNGTDEVGEPRDTLAKEVHARGLDDRVFALHIGEQRVVLAR
jgi:N-acyl-phosphatidylethanolamine-hydrolysing phospholipase D